MSQKRNGSWRTPRFHDPLLWSGDLRLLSPRRAPLLDIWDALSAAPHGHRLIRTGPKTLEIEVIDGQMLATSLEKVWPPARPFVAGDVVTSAHFDAEILEIAELGPTRVRFRFRDCLDRNLELLTWGSEILTEVAIPAVGESLNLPYVPSPVNFPGTQGDRTGLEGRQAHYRSKRRL